MRIVYMGTPQFAVEPLRLLVEAGHNVAGVVTMPDKPAGRGHHIQYSPVKQYALEHHLPLLQPDKLKDPDFLGALRDWQADLQVVVAFRMLPEAVWAMPPQGTFNLHASLLPQYRGAAPINWAIINGETETGVTTFFLSQGMDTGRIIDSRRIPILPTDNAGTLHDKLMTLGARLVVDTVDSLARGPVATTSQDQTAVTGPLHPAPKIFKETCRVDWSQPVLRIHNFVRGLSPYPAAWAELTLPDGAAITPKLYETTPLPEAHTLPVGTVLTDGRTYLRIAAADGFVAIHSLQLPGKKRMNTDEWLRGVRVVTSQ